MRQEEKIQKNKKAARLFGVLLCIAIMLLCTALLPAGSSFEATHAAESPKATPGLEPSPTPEVSSAPEPAPTPEPTPMSELAPTPELTLMSEPTPTAETDVETLLRRYRKSGQEAREEIENGLAALREQDPAWGELWTGLFERMFAINRGMEIPETVPAGLPDDDSLCIVVFGFELRPDGSIRSELVGRCEAVLACAQAYPNAYIALTGGRTAAENRLVSEAGVMSHYLMDRGVAEDRLILDPNSYSTPENAVNLNAILTEQYPQIKSLVIVSSSYHVPLCQLLMEETALIDAYEQGSKPYEVVGCMGYFVASHSDWESPSILVENVRSVAARKLG